MSHLSDTYQNIIKGLYILVETYFTQYLPNKDINEMKFANQNR